jgi:AcrR family transcriptional regulator
MNRKRRTPQAILAAARELFARQGYAGTSVRAITAKAGANLGAVTYHFGSKEELYLAVMLASARPLLDRIEAASSGQGGALDRIEAALRGLFAHLDEYREAGPLALQELSMNRPLPAPMRSALEWNIKTIARFIREGQEGGVVVAGDPTLLALSVIAQPLYYTLARSPLREVVGVDRDDPETQARVVDHVVAFVRRGLAADGRSPS